MRLRILSDLPIRNHGPPNLRRRTSGSPAKMDTSRKRKRLFCGGTHAETAKQGRSTGEWSGWHHYENNLTPLPRDKPRSSGCSRSFWGGALGARARPCLLRLPSWRYARAGQSAGARRRESPLSARSDARGVAGAFGTQGTVAVNECLSTSVRSAPAPNVITTVVTFSLLLFRSRK